MAMGDSVELTQRTTATNEDDEDECWQRMMAACDSDNQN
eukprot:CAMPEP_0172477742 /NCGR_PEP_ID=MMETSP1066-20121228/1184_1 /TAXON_ID=671091 /ORGANISM="Coscinodiscus wailesii, Strain CCMP2513" /LENGTH=38 /DNA_ID= /DNA_START= /DNA_END= /DNA_ORIENTATION=